MTKAAARNLAGLAQRTKRMSGRTSLTALAVPGDLVRSSAARGDAAWRASRAVQAIAGVLTPVDSSKLIDPLGNDIS